MTKKKILYVDDDHNDIEKMKGLFTEDSLSKLYDFDAIHCPMNHSETWEDHKNAILLEINQKKAGVQILLLDMILTDKLDDGTPLSLLIADILKSDNSNNFKIVFVTGYTSKNTLLTQDKKWDNQKYLLRNKPILKLPIPKINEGFCPPPQIEKCNEKNLGNCTQKECFIKYMELLWRGEINHD